jgi:GDPmannose 4,6-dehydratase
MKGLKTHTRGITNMKIKTAFITGINGQDGSYLAELLLKKGYKVVGLVRRLSVPEAQTSRLEEAGVYPNDNLHLEYGDCTDESCLLRIMTIYQPDEIYNLAAQSHVRVSFDAPQFTTNVVANGALNVLEAMRVVCPNAKMYQAGSSEMFGNSIDLDGFQRESTPMIPVSPYGCAKLYAYNICRNYRESYKMHVSNGILFNHESPRRGGNFVTNKVVRGAFDILEGKTNTLSLGNLKATRDWGHSKDYVYAMWKILQQKTPGDYVCSTARSHSVQDLVDYVFKKLDLCPDQHIIIDPQYFRPEELDDLKGDYSKARRELDWSPKITFESLLDEMIEVERNKRKLDNKIL